MRHADDISDDPNLPAAERKRRLSEFLEAYHKVAAGAQTDDPVFMALRDSQSVIRSRSNYSTCSLRELAWTSRNRATFRKAPQKNRSLHTRRSRTITDIATTLLQSWD
jgi:hypothetical protein